jgi:hypothetical protein
MSFLHNGKHRSYSFMNITAAFPFSLPHGQTKGVFREFQSELLAIL